jgi:alpha 1,2-mannosyltransferase
LSRFLLLYGNSPPIDRHTRPEVNFFCELDYDPFLFMQGEDKKYGASSPIRGAGIRSSLNIAFTISTYEFRRTIPTLWRAVKGIYGLDAFS